MTDLVVAIIEGGKEIELSTGEKVKVRPLSLGVVRAMISELNSSGGIPRGLEAADIRAGLDMIPFLLKVPTHLAKLCGKEPDWFEALPIIDELLIAETAFEVSMLEVVIPRFFGLVERGKGLATKLK